MRKFKHISTNREFAVKPIGCNAVDGIAWGDWEIPMWVLENGQDWEEIKEKDYEILSFKSYKDNIVDLSYFTCEENFIGNSIWRIHSVKRLSDGEVFSVGDTLNFNDKGDSILIRIDFERAPADKGTGRLCFVNDNQLLGDWWGIKELHKVKDILLTTEDGVEIYGGEKLHLVTKCFRLGVGLNFTKDELKDKDYLFFAEKENAERFINLNKPQYSIKDIVPIVNNWSMSGIDEDTILNFLARKQ